jgi:hypothetical protein
MRPEADGTHRERKRREDNTREHVYAVSQERAREESREGGNCGERTRRVKIMTWDGMIVMQE